MSRKESWAGEDGRNAAEVRDRNRENVGGDIKREQYVRT